MKLNELLYNLVARGLESCPDDAHLSNALALIELMEDEDYPEVRVATQPTYPLSCEIANVGITDDSTADGEDVIWVAAANNDGYAPREAWNA